MDVIKLRTLTEKSVVGWKKLKYKKVSYALEGSNKIFLVYMYFNLSKINFTDDVLDKLHITKKDRINKPGTDGLKYYSFLEKSYYYNLEFDNGNFLWPITKIPSKALLMSKNHGH